MTCTICRRLFSSDGPDICPICMEHIDAGFQTVRNYIETNPGADVDARILTLSSTDPAWAGRLDPVLASQDTVDA